MARPLAAAIAVLLALLLAASPASAQAPDATPQLIDRAVERGELSRAQGLRTLALALARPAALPGRFRSTAPWDGTAAFLRLRRDLPKVRDAAARREVRSILNPRADSRINDEPSLNCSVLSVGPNPQVLETEHFYIEYPADEVFAGGLTVQDYADSLEGAWAREIGDFGYAAPPLLAPGGKYNVRIGPTAPGLYGFVAPAGTYAGTVGDNTNTTDYVEDDADATCMGLNSDYSDVSFGNAGTPQGRLDATTAHEFLHSIQFGYGALDGSDFEPDLNFSEGHATWMEDEVYDGADDNHNYLYPDFRDSMGEHDEGNEYAYWLTWRGLTERFGTNTPNAGEDVIQRFWETTRREERSSLDAMSFALAPEGLSLEDGFHDYAIASRFLKRCGGGYALPYCFEEADAYADVAGGRPEPDGAIDAPGGSAGNEIEDNLALNWIDLPDVDAPLDVTLAHGGSAGALRLSVICDTGTTIRRSGAVRATAGATATVRFDAGGCASRPSAVLTNETRTAANPEESTFAPYAIGVVLAPAQEQRTAEDTTGGTQPNGGTPITGTTGPRACTAGAALVRATLRTRGKRLRLAFAPRDSARVDITVFQQSVGRRVTGERIVARFRNRARGFTWNGKANREGRRVRDGFLFVRFRARNGSAVETRRLAVRRTGGRFRIRPPFARRERCEALQSFKLLRPVFGGRGSRAAFVTYRLERAARVRLELVRDGRVVRRYLSTRRAGGRTYRQRVSAKGIRRGDIRFRLRITRGGRTETASVVGRRL